MDTIRCSTNAIMLTFKSHNCRGIPCRTVTSVPCTLFCQRQARALTTKACISTLHKPCSARLLSQKARHHPNKTVTPTAYLNSDGSGSGGSAAQPGQLKVVVIGASAAGLAAALALAQQAGCAVEVHDSRADPRDDKRANNISTLVGLGKRGLEVLAHLNLPPPKDGGRAFATVTTPHPQADAPTPSSSSSGAQCSPQGISGLWAPGSANLGVITPPATEPHRAEAASSQGLGMTELNPEPLSGLTLLQGMVVAGPQGHRREVYSRPASRSKPHKSAVTAGKTAGIVAIDELALTIRLLSAAAALSHTATASTHALEPQLVLPGSASTAAAQDPLQPRKGTTPVPQGPTSTPSAEAAQEAAMPPTAPPRGTAAPAATTPAVGVGQLDPQGVFEGGAVGSGSVEVMYGSHLTLLDTANKTATFMGRGGGASVVKYDLIVAADPAGGGHLVTSALQELQERQVQHKHPTAAAGRGTHGLMSHPTDVAEMEYKAWHDMPSEPELTALLGDGASRIRSTGGVSSTPQQGWLLVWTGPGSTQAAHPSLSSTAENNTALIPGAPGCTVMAWPSKRGGTWSGCGFTHPQVFEALRSQSDYERFLGSVSAAASTTGQTKLPAVWVRGIAAQLKRCDRVGRVPAALSTPPHSLTAPAAGVVSLSTAAVPSHSPQLLSPGLTEGLAEATALAAHLAEGVTHTPAVSAEAKQQVVQQGLQEFDRAYGGEAQALHKLTAQLSWLRHPLSPAAPAAAAAVPWGSLAWIGAVLGAPRTGLALQWKCLLAVLPLVTAVQRVLLYKLGLGQADVTHAKKRPAVPDASYRKPQAGGAASTSMDSGVHVDSATGSAAQRQKETAALSALAGQQRPAYSLADVLDGIEPCGTSFLAFLHTTDMSPAGIWRLLQAAPLLVSVLWGALFWAAAQALRWGVWAYRAWGWAQSGVA